VPSAKQVKTTAPKKYCVRPNRASVEPFASKAITIIMRSHSNYPDDYDTSTPSNSRDKFLVQSTIVPPKQVQQWETLLDANTNANHDLSECRLHVRYVQPQQPPSPIKEESDQPTNESEPGTPAGSAFVPTSDDEFRTHQQQQQKNDFGKRTAGDMTKLTEEFATTQKAPPLQARDASEAAVESVERPPASRLSEVKQQLQSSPQHEYSISHVLVASLLAFIIGLIIGRR